jgi:hypothetical protein
VLAIAVRRGRMHRVAKGLGKLGLMRMFLGQPSQFTVRAFVSDSLEPPPDSESDARNRVDEDGRDIGAPGHGHGRRHKDLGELDRHGGLPLVAARTDGPGCTNTRVFPYPAPIHSLNPVIPAGNDRQGMNLQHRQ